MINVNYSKVFLNLCVKTCDNIFDQLIFFWSASRRFRLVGV